MTLTAGARLGPYEIVGPLGAGGMGEVYRARDPRLGRDVAVKVLPSSPDSDQLRRLELEARVAGALNHPNILAIYDVGSQDGAPYVVSELLEGTTLRERLMSGPLPVRRALDYAVQVARGLAAAHEKRIVHRDLKPDNLFVTKDGRVKILDFGLARVLRPARRREDRTQSIVGSDPFTEPGKILGTVGYMSPEQVRGQAVDHRSDFFSFGAILYETLSGRRAFHGDSAVETMNAILKQDPPELAITMRGLSPAVERLVKHCLEKEPDQRFQSARDLAFDCESLTVVSGPALPTFTRRRGTGPLLALLAAATLMASYATVFVAGKRAGLAPQPTFRRLTFRPGAIGAARLASDGQTIVYSAAWEGRPSELFSTRPESPETRSLGLPPAEILAISSSGELAVTLERSRVSSWASKGTLARVPLLGGVPRQVLEDVVAADWRPDGRELAVVRDLGGRNRLELPIGRPLYEAPWISDPRISPKGDAVAFVSHPLREDDRGSVTLVDLRGRQRTLSREWSSVQGLAWSPSGEEIWFTASDGGPGSRALHAVTLAGSQRVVERSAGGFRLHDVSRDGRVLLAHENARRAIMGLTPGETRERDLSWLDWSVAHDLSADGKTLLFGEEGQGGGAAYAVCLRRTDGSPALRLGEGDGIALSPDGRWALSRPVTPDRLVLLPTGPGEARVLKHEAIGEYRGAAWFPDGKRILFNAKDGTGLRAFVQDLEQDGPRAVTPEGTQGLLVSPDGKQLVTQRPDRTFWLQPLDSGEPHPIPGIAAGDWPICWAADGRSLYVYRTQELPARVYRLHLQSGRRELWKEINPPDPAGVVNIRRVLLTPDGKAYVYDYRRFLSDLYLVEGLR